MPKHIVQDRHTVSISVAEIRRFASHDVQMNIPSTARVQGVAADGFIFFSWEGSEYEPERMEAKSEC